MRIRHAFASPFGRSTRPAPGLEHRRSRYGGWPWDRAGPPACHGRWHRDGRGLDLLSNVAQQHRRLVRRGKASTAKERECRPPIPHSSLARFHQTPGAPGAHSDGFAPASERSVPAQSCGKTRGQDTVWGAIGYQISLSASDSPESAGSDLCRLAASSDWKVGSGAANSQLGREAADPIVIRTSCWVVYGRKIKMAAAEFQESLKIFLKGLLTPSSPHLFGSSPGACRGPARTGGPGSNPLIHVAHWRMWLWLTSIQLRIGAP